MKPSVWVIILNWENAEETLACLKTLENVSYSQKHILVVDNGSRDASQKILRAYQAPYPYTVLAHNENLGYAGGNTIGVRYALRHHPDYICILNNDTRVDAEFLEKLIEDAERHPRAGIWGPLIYTLPEKEGNDIWYAGGILQWFDIAQIGKHLHAEGTERSERAPQKSEGYETEFVTGCCLMARRSVWEKLGGFDPRFFLYFEDIDLNLRAQKYGWTCRVVPQAIIWHNVSATSMSKLGSPGMLYYHHRNGMLLARLRGPWRVKLYMHAWAFGKLLKQYVKLFAGKDVDESRAIAKGIWDYYKNKFYKE